MSVFSERDKRTHLNLYDMTLTKNFCISFYFYMKKGTISVTKFCLVLTYLCFWGSYHVFLKMINVFMRVLIFFYDIFMSNVDKTIWNCFYLKVYIVKFEKIREKNSRLVVKIKFSQNYFILLSLFFFRSLQNDLNIFYLKGQVQVQFSCC